MAGLSRQNKAFNRQLEKYLRVVQKTGTKEIRSVALKALQGVMRKSPVDNGTFKGNWNVGLNTIDESTNKEYESDSKLGRYNREIFIRGSAVIGGFKTGDDINISNALPYANLLEYKKHSAQGTGMVRRTLMELTIAMKKKSKKV